MFLESLEDRRLLAADLPGLDYAPESFLVQFEQGATPQSLLDGTKIGEELGFGILEVHVQEPSRLAEAVDFYRGLDFVEFAELDYTLTVDTIPNDPGFDSLYGLNNTGQSGGLVDADIDAPEAWDVTTGSDSIVVAVIDTGIDYTHPDLAANIWANVDEIAGNGIDDDGNGYIDDTRGWDFVGDDNDPMDDNFHGTHVAGTIGAVGNNGIGVAGVAWDVRLMPLKFLNSSGSGSLSDAIRALDYAADNGAQIANNSWGGGGFSLSLSAAIDRYQAAGGLFVAAAGNSSQDNDVRPSYPASYPQDNVIAVAASDRYDQLAAFSNYGASSVDIAAPGVSILSTRYGGGYATASGTSMAAPHVSGAAALVWSAHPEFTYLQVKNALLDNADPVLLNVVEHGRLNVAAAVSAGSEADTSGPRITSAAWSGAGNTLDTLRVTFSEPVEGASFAAQDVALSGPSGAVVVDSVQEVAGSNGREWAIRFTAQSSIGVYQATVGPDIVDLAGNPMNQDGDGLAGESPDDRFLTTARIEAARQFEWTGDVALRDAYWWWAGSTTLALDVAEDVRIDDIEVQVNITHTWVSDLRLILYAPDGTNVMLFNRRGGSGDDLQATFDDEAAVSISAGAAPFDGTFRPEESLSLFDGGSTRGRWLLQVLDLAQGDRGRITGWSLNVSPRTAMTSSGALQNARFGMPFDLPGARTRTGAITAPPELDSQPPRPQGWESVAPSGGEMSSGAVPLRAVDRVFAERQSWREGLPLDGPLLDAEEPQGTGNAR